ncbi:MAG: sugar kinase [Acidimicrobiales bacterium]|jgi:sugar/nucleoside kinase (ribokinase family)
MNRQVVVVIGDVINDIIVRPCASIAVGTDTPSDIERSAGGSGANQAAWLGALGTPVRFVGRAGAADAGFHQSALERVGVEASIARDDILATGTIVVLVSSDGERSMFTDRGANLALASADVPAGLLEGARLLHLSGYQLFEPQTRSVLRRLWEDASRAGAATSVDPASVAGLRQVGPGAFLEWTSGAQFAFPNLDEAQLLTGAEEPEEIVTVLLESYGVVALKLGPAGALIASSDGRRIRVEAEPARIVDSTGAGDAFCAGFLAAWSKGADLEACALDAVKAAACVVGQLGARPRLL